MSSFSDAFAVSFRCKGTERSPCGMEGHKPLVNSEIFTDRPSSSGVPRRSFGHGDGDH